MAGIHECDESVELHDQQLLYPEHRFTEHVQEHENCRNHVQVTGEEIKRVLPVLALNEVFVGESLSSRFVRVLLSRCFGFFVLIFTYLFQSTNEHFIIV